MGVQLFYGGNVDCYWILKPQDGCSNRGCTFLVERLGKNLAHIYWEERKVEEIHTKYWHICHFCCCYLTQSAKNLLKSGSFQILVEKNREINNVFGSNYSLIISLFILLHLQTTEMELGHSLLAGTSSQPARTTAELGWNSHIVVLSLPPCLQAIGVRLNELCHAESESPANLLGLIYDEETKRRLRKEDEEEDFLDDSKETPFTTRTPACKNLCFRST